MNSMGSKVGCLRYSFGLTTLCSCAEEPDNAYPGNTQNKALKSRMTQNRPDLLENYQEEGSITWMSFRWAIWRTVRFWRRRAGRYYYHGADLQGNISVARDSVYALQQGTFTPYTHYVPYYQFYGELASGTFKEGTYLAMRNPLKLGETYAAQKRISREVELRWGPRSCCICLRRSYPPKPMATSVTRGSMH